MAAQMPRVIGHITPDMTLSAQERASDRAQAAAERVAVKAMRDMENEIREQAIGEQDGWLLDIADRMREALRKL